jgi:hypothetical protein
MQITTEELLAEAGQLALENRLKDKSITRLEAENAALLARVAHLESVQDPAGGPEKDGS